MIPWILVSIALAVIILAILGILIMKKKGWKREVDYRNYFTMGIVWLPFGIIFLIFGNTTGTLFLLMGVVFLSIGLKNRDKWGKPQKVSPKSQKMLMISVLIGVVALIVGILVFELMV